MRFILGVGLIIWRISPLFGLESSLFGDGDWNLFDANSATVSPAALNPDLDWTADVPDDIFGLVSNSVLPLDGADMVLDDFTIADACVNSNLQRRGQNTMQCDTVPPKESETSPEITETTPSITSLFIYELCPASRSLVFPVCDSGNRFDRQAHFGGYFELASCNILNLAVGCFHPRRIWCCIVVNTKNGVPIDEFYNGHILDALQGLFDANFCTLQDPERPVEHMPPVEREYDPPPMT